MDPNNEIAHEFLPFLRQYKDGRIERFLGTDRVPPSVDPTTGVSSKDVPIGPESGVSARLYLPKITNEGPKKLPILVYIHGGGFCVESASSPTYQHYLNLLAAEANVVIVSVDYRLAPEHPIPAAYDDSWAALQWVASHVNGLGPDPWVNDNGDFDRITLAGDSAGGNIVHNMLIRAGSSGLSHGVKIYGAVLIHPFFWGCGKSNPSLNHLWSYLCPSTCGTNDPLINPTAVGAPSLSGLGCTWMVIHLAEKDFLIDEGRNYYQAVKSSGWEGALEIIEVDSEGHVFHLHNRASEKAGVMMKQFASFINHGHPAQP